MIPQISELMADQLKTFIVMFGAGIVVESLWLVKKYGQEVCRKISTLSQVKSKGILEIIFWILSAVTLSAFLYYCSFGAITFHGLIGFLTGLLLWKKICCGILKTVWAEKEEVENLKTTARSSVLKRPENKGWKKGKLKRKEKKNA